MKADSTPQTTPDCSSHHPHPIPTPFRSQTVSPWPYRALLPSPHTHATKRPLPRLVDFCTSDCRSPTPSACVTRRPRQ
ncbi:hypothetical protein E2C01_007952 [Portunus trituberculatus]|uniref:Uncharacterized protein n=1 Tax=Portunus trituberculatus TaxID=210409 RepID=A0A5B7D116_PORTR|nr:hypothetical protein [Portunus trituberculatus]